MKKYFVLLLFFLSIIAYSDNLNKYNSDSKYNSGSWKIYCVDYSNRVIKCGILIFIDNKYIEIKNNNNSNIYTFRYEKELFFIGNLGYKYIFKKDEIILIPLFDDIFYKKYFLERIK